MAEPETPARTRWAVSWDETRDALLDSTRAATPTRRLVWLEEVLRLAYRSGALPFDDSRTGVEREP